ncbi:MAG: hypothetical protein ACE5I1_33400 [bacterium]
MRGLEKLHARYMQDPIPVRLGGLAANLSRVASFSKHAEHKGAVSEMMQESKWFIEWTAAELEIERAAELVRLQVRLAAWQVQAQTEWDNESWGNRLITDSRQWSERLLETSGLLQAN